jgi:glyoxylase-like metal-dependent hydrolase (beta-lactamase superfamily II)
MVYSGTVTVGGPPHVRELSHLIVTKVAVGPMDNNAYLLRCRRTDAMCLIDAAAEPDTLLKLIGDGNLERVVTTHRHGDHWQALADVVDETGARTAAGRKDAEGIPVPTAELLDDGDEVPMGEARLRVITLVGHTPGSVALMYDDPTGPPHLFTGDSLFPGGPGATTRPENFQSLMHDLETKVFGVLPDETWIYPGHGRDTTIGAERRQLPEWRERGW